VAKLINGDVWQQDGLVHGGNPYTIKVQYINAVVGDLGGWRPLQL